MNRIDPFEMFIAVLLYSTAKTPPRVIDATCRQFLASCDAEATR